MDILEDLRTTTFSNNEAFFKKAACEIEQLRTENAALKERYVSLQLAQADAAANGVQAEACGECGAIHATGANSLCDK